MTEHLRGATFCYRDVSDTRKNLQLNSDVTTSAVGFGDAYYNGKQDETVSVVGE